MNEMLRQLNQDKKNFASYASMKERIMHEFQKEYGTDVARSFKKMAAIDILVEEPNPEVEQQHQSSKASNRADRT